MLYNTEYVVSDITGLENKACSSSINNCTNKNVYPLPCFQQEPHVECTEMDANKVNNNFNNQMEILEKNRGKQYDKNIAKLNNVNKKIFVGEIGGNNINQNEKVKKKEYDPYYNFLYHHGLLNNDSINNYSRYYVNIDSMHRNTIPYGVYDNITQLNDKSILFTRNSSNVKIYNIGHTYLINDRVSLSNITGKTIKLMTYGYVNLDMENIESGELSTNKIKQTTFEFIPNTPYMKIYFSHQLYIEKNITFNGTNYVFNNDEFYETFDISNLNVNISGIRSNMFDANIGSYFDNIPLVMINNQHNIIITDPFDGKIRRNIFYIKLNKIYIPMNEVFQTPSPSYAFSITFNYIGGIPINLLNTGYPISINNINGYHVISDITKNNDGIPETYSFQTTSVSCGIINEDENEYKLETNYIGGNNVIEKKVVDIVKGYVDQNHYKINLSKAFTNVISVKMVSSEFPNTEPIIRSHEANITKNNNKLYWQNMDDGDYVYSFSVDEGVYDLTDLRTVLQEKFYNTPRIYYNRDNIDNTYSKKTTPSYTNHNYVIIVVNPSTGVILFKSYRELFLFKPIIAITPEIPLDFTQDQDFLINYVLTIRHPNHGINLGDNILLSNVVDTMGIPSSVISAEHIVTSILDKDTYQITLPAVNLSTVRNDVKGGVNVGVYVPNMMRLRFDYQDTLGSLLGFRDVGLSTSITPYKFPISTNDMYYNELTVDVNGDKKKIGPNSINLGSYNYILIVCNQIESLINNGPIKNAFAKILMSDSPQKTIFNSFVLMSSTVDIAQLSELEFSFYTPYGLLYNFNGLDHSFTLEITTLNNIPSNTNINSLTGI